MVERVETVRLTAQVSNFIAGMEKARLATSATATEAQKLAAQKEAFNTLGLGLLAFGGLVSAGLLLAVSKMADFDAKMSQVQTLSHATSADMDKLSDSALHMGQAIGFSASQVADAEIELVKAGVTVKDQLGGGLVGTLNLAAAGQLDVADATQIAASAMTQFALKGKDVPHIADLLAAGADKALGSVQDLGNGLKFVGPVAHSMGVSLDATVGTLALFAQNGILGEQAGTGLRGVLLSLTSPSKLASDVMKQYGINLYDASGKFIGLSATAEQLKKGLGGLTDAQRDQALGQIFGNQQITEATILMQGGSKAVDKWTKSVNAQGFAAEQAAGKMDNLKGDISKLQAAVDTGLIESATGANGALRGLVQGLTSVVSTISSLPEPVLQTGLAIGGIVGVAALLGGTVLVAVPKIVAFRSALATLTAESAVAQGALGKMSSFLAGPWGIALVAAAVGLDLFQKYLDSLKASSGEVTAALTKAKSAADILAVAAKGADAGGSLENTAEQFKNLDDVLDNFALSVNGNLTEITGAKTAFGGAFESLNRLGDQMGTLAQTDLPSAQRAFRTLGDETDGSRLQLGRLLNAMPAYKQALIEQATASGDYSEKLSDAEKKTVLLNYAQGKGTTAASQNAAALADISDKAQDASGDVSELADQIKGFASGTLDARAAERDFQAAVDDLTQSVQNNGASLDINTDAGRQNQAALDKIATSALAAAAATYTQTGSVDDATKAVQDGRDALIAQLGQFGVTGQAAQDYANQLGLVPANITTLLKVNGDTSGVDAALDGTAARLQKIASAVTNAVSKFASLGSVNASGQANGSILSFYANGGENHVAQVAPAGAWRVWAEPETGGEAYIPLAGSKRARSTSILATVAGQFGYGLTPYAAGGYVASSYVRGKSAGSNNDKRPSSIPVNIRVEGETDPRAFAALAGQAVASRLRGIR